MKIENIKIENIRSYGTENVTFDDGLMLIHGDNGSGKSSLLGSIFGGLYLSNVLDYIDTDLTLDSLVRRTKDNGKISLTFSVGDDMYTVEWEISVTEDANGERTASTKSCTLVGDVIDEPIEGVKSVDTAIEEIIGLGPESFVNSVYVQQGDITRMVDANDEKRKEIIDGLLGLSKLDIYIERMHKARREIGAQVRKYNNLLDEKERQLDEYDEKSALEQEINDLKSKKENLRNKKERANEIIDTIKDERTEIKQKLDSQKEIQSQIDEAKNKEQKYKNKLDEWQSKQTELEQEITVISKEKESIESKIDTLCAELDLEINQSKIEDKLESIKNKHSNLDAKISTVINGDISNLDNELTQKEDRLDTLQTKLSQKKSDKKTIEKTIENIEKEKQTCVDNITQIEDSLDKLNSNLNDICDKFDIDTTDTPVEIRDVHLPEVQENLLERTQKIYSNLGEKTNELELYDELENTGYCPICNEEHENIDDEIHNQISIVSSKKQDISQKADAIKKQQEFVDEANSYIDKIISKKSELDKKQNNKEHIGDKLENKRSQLDQNKQDISEIEESISDIENRIQEIRIEKSDLQDKIEEERNQLEEYEMKIEDINKVINAFDRLNDISDEIDNRESSFEMNKDMVKETRNQYLDAKQEVTTLENKIKDIDTKELNNQYSELENKLNQANKTKSNAEEKLDTYRDKLAEKKQVLKQVKSIKNRCRELESLKTNAAEKEVESEKVISSYKNVKTQLRKENIGLLNKYANEVFKSVYHSKVYQRLEIDEDYSINLVTGDGVSIKPKELSGGEETIVSLAIRAGVYRLLVERNGNADKLPPFILDEPTTFLDTNHVSNLQDVIDTITGWDVPQVIIVSHKNDLIQNADISYEIKKNPVTETSDVTMTRL